MATHYILPISHPRLPDSVGTKARNIRNLKDKGYQVPDTFVCTWDAYLEYLRDDVQLLDRLMMELAGIIDPDRSYAVRSSANLEDSLNYSFAGQFKTMLRIHGIQQVMQAIWAIWASTQSLEVGAYVNKLPIDHHGIRMAVILQEMVTPVVSGVAFSKNPITSLDEIIVEAVSGSGDQLVQAGVTPSRWVNKWGNWIELPETTEIPLGLIEEVAAQTQRIARSFNKDVDLEWVYNGKELYWVQMRDITSIQTGNIYSNRISKEMIPGLIKPLVWSVSVPTHSALWVSILHDLVGKNEIDLSQMIRAFHYRAYFNISVFGNIFDSLGMPRESLEMMMGLIPQGAKRPAFKMKAEMVGKIPRLSRFIWNYSHFDRIAEKELPQLEARLASYSLAGPSTNEQQILAELEDLQLVYRQASHDTIIVQLLMFIYSRLLKWRLNKLGVDFNRFDLTEGMDELKQFDPNTGLSVLNQKFRLINDRLQNKIYEGGYAELQSLPEVKSFFQELSSFIDQFGHLSDSAVDFSYVPWRETPDLILKIVMDYQRNSDSEMGKIHFGDLPAHGFSAWMIGFLYRKARQFRFYREAFSSLFSKSLGLLRTYYLTLAESLVERGILADKTDIFFLYHSEVKQIVSGELQARETLPLVARRKEEMVKCESIVLPEIIYGETPPPVISNPSIKRLCGVATSGGYYTGRVKVIHNLKEFHKLEARDVLVIPFSDTGWLPLFARAGAVITESGGMLSHSSIIAREYGIPAVVSVPGALGLKDDTLVSIDGFKGEIQVLED